MKIKNKALFKKEELLHFYILRFIFGISYSFMIPIIPTYFSCIGISTFIIGTVMSLYGVGKALAQITFGMVVNFMGDKLLLMISLALMACVPLGYNLVDSKVLASGIYVIQGTVLGMAAPATFSILSRSLIPEKRGECTGYASAVFTLGGSIGAIIGGFIASKLNNYKMVFYISSIGMVVCLIFLWLKINRYESIPEKCKKSNEKVRCSIRVIIEDIKKYNFVPRIVMLGAIALLGDFIYGCIVSMFPFYGQEVLGGSSFFSCAIISIYLFVFGIFAPLGGVVSDKIGVEKQLFFSFIAMSCSLLALSFIRSIVLFSIVILVYFLGATFLNSALQNALLEFGEIENIKGFVFGFVGASESTGYVLGPMVSAYIYNLNKEWLFIGLLVISLLVFFLYIILRKSAFQRKKFS